MTGARGRLAQVLGLALLIAPAATAAGPLPVHLPRDHFAHPQAGIEWWYVTGLVRGRDGHRYTVFFTLFRRGALVLPVSQVVDLDHDAILGHSERVAAATVGTTRLNVSAAGAALAYDENAHTWRFSATAPGYALSFSARPEKPYILHGGGTGLIRQSLAGPSAYYSATRMAAQGTIAAGGRTVSFAGTAWLDHQWGSFENDARAFNWDWFSCRFDDRTELMLYRFRDRRTGAPLAAYLSGTFVARGGSSRAVGAFTTDATRVLRAAGRRWPLDWRLRVPALRLDVRLRSLARNQLFRGVLVPTFWEAATAATGTKRGTCFVEEAYR